MSLLCLCVSKRNSASFLTKVDTYKQTDLNAPGSVGGHTIPSLNIIGLTLAIPLEIFIIFGMGMIDNIRSANNVKSAQEFLDTLKGYGAASAKTVRRAERALALKEKELTAPKKIKKTTKKKK